MVKYEEKEAGGAWEDRFPENDECSKDDRVDLKLLKTKTLNSSGSVVFYYSVC